MLCRVQLNTSTWKKLVEVNPEWDKWIEVQAVDKTKFDFTWRPDPREPAYIYTWGNKYIDAKMIPTLEYHCEGATERKYMTNDVCVLPEWGKWIIPKNLDTTKFDFTWRPDPREPAFIYQFGTQWQKTGGPRYVCEDATEIKYLDIQKVKILPNKENWTVPTNIDISEFDFSWHPDATSPPYVYRFPTQWAMSGGPIYTVENATEVKYIDATRAIALPDRSNWEINEYIDSDSFDFSWHPYAEDEPYIYQFGTQWQKTGGPKYMTPGTHENSPIKYIDTRIIKAKRLPNKKAFNVLDNNIIIDFDYSWHPDDTDEPYIYVFGNNQYSAEIMPTIEYVVDGATQFKYVTDIISTLGENKTKWIIPNNIDDTGFDYSWVPNPKDPVYIYEFGTQWQKTGGPRYIMDDASEVKYIDIQKVISLSDKNKFKIIADCKVKDFDYTWHPDYTEPLYIYHFGNDKFPAEIMPTVEYVVEGATEVKYINDVIAILDKKLDNWVIPDNVDVTTFDFSWIPNPKDPAYIYEFGTLWQKTGGPRYVVDGATEIKYVDSAKVKISPNKKNFNILDNLEVADFDYSWHPDSTEKPYIYVFGNSQYPAEIMPTIEYLVEGATEIKYINDVVAKLGENKNNWVIPSNIDISEFDFSWIPNPKDPAYIYEFGTQWQKTGGPRYAVPGAEQIKYIDGSKAKALPNKTNWILPPQLNIIEFDYSWHPDTTDDPFIYEFGTQWHDRGGPKYTTKDATEVKYITTTTAKLGKSTKNWEIPSDVDTSEFDFSWIPHPNESPYIYQFGTQHQKTGGPRYVVEGATETKYIDLIKSKRLPSKKYWFNPNQADTSKFDFSWHPDETAPPYIYQFGTLLDKEDGPRYMSPNTNGEIIYLERVETIDEDIPEVENFSKYVITTTLEDLINKHPNELFWALNPDLDYSEFDFDWRPDIEQSQYLHAFGSQDSINTQTYFVNAVAWLKGFKEINYVEDKTIDVKINIDMFFVDRSNSESQDRFEKLKIKFPNIQKTRYLNSWVDTINRCINRASSNLCWVLNSELDYSDFDFDYYPNTWQMKMVHVFGTQWSHWGTTFMVNRETFAQDTKYIKIIEHLSNLNFVKDRKAKATNILYDIVYIDHGNMDMTRYKQEGKIVIPYQNSYIATLQKMLSILPVKKEHYIWVASSICDYNDFDFTYICDPFAKEQLHVFPSDRQKFGDTFLVDVNKLRTLIEDMNILEDYEKINYNQSQRVKRLPAPVIITEEDTHITSIKTEFKFPYAVFTTKDNQNINVVDTKPMSLWAPESKNIQITSVGGTRIVVPKEAKEYVKRELYDYPYIITNSRLAKSSPLDIVFFSNGEASADSNYEHLLTITRGLPNKITRIDGVSGRVNSQHAAANSSNSAWYFLVNAKLKVNSKFDFGWQPDRLQIPKHYIFHATNPVNGLKYGHQAIVANNKKLTLENFGNGLDFTMDSEHEIIKINSGIAVFNTNEWDTWRTAFRECIKLKASNTDENKERLEIWSTVGMGKFSQYSLDAAQHAAEYYNEVNGDFDKLKLSYDWPWLKAYYENKYK